MKIIIKNLSFFIIVFILISFFNTYLVSANSCKYQGQINKCISAQTGSPKSIEDFVCITGNNEEIMYQIILDMEFKKVDKKMDKYLEKLENNKSAYFGVGSGKSYIDGINDIHSVGDDFKRDYYKLCGNDILKEAIACGNNNKTTLNNAKNYFVNDGSSCKKLVEKKISIYKDVAFSVLMLNKQQINSDDKKKYDQAQRSNYDHLLDIMMINVGYIERIWQKWPSKLANPH